MKKNLIPLLFFCLALISCTTQKHFSFNRGEAAQSGYFATVPFEEVGGLMIVPAEINGKTYRFIFDTGASNIVSETLHKELGLQVLEKISLSDQSGKKDSALVANLPSISLGGAAFNNIPAVVAADSTFFLQCFQADGFIGSNMLRNSVVRISLPEKNITIADNPQSLNVDKKHSLKLFLTPNQSAPYFYMDLESGKKGRVQLLFDTGMQGLFHLSAQHYNFFKKRNIFNEIGVSTGSNTIGLFGKADDVKTYKLLLPQMKISQMRMENAVVQTTANQNSRMGAELLKYATVTLDYRNKRIYVEPILSDNPINAYEKTFPINPNFQNDTLIVGFVWDENLKAKITEGDRILYVDDIDCRNIQLCDLLRNSPFSQKDNITLTVEKTDGSIQKVEIEKR